MLLALAHLPSKLNSAGRDQEFTARRLSRHIREVEMRRGHQRTLILGDLNANPFEESITTADGLHGVMTQSLARAKPRTFRGERFPFFYNPMWSRMGDLSLGPPGTWFRRESKLAATHWHTLDQCLLRPDLLPLFDPDAFSVLDRVGTVRLACERKVNRGDLPDHLPLVLALRS